jgi:hypothetical protein
MNLHGLVSGAIAVVNPLIPLGLRISTGNAEYGDGSRIPTYATPGAMVASIAGTVMSVRAITPGTTLQVGQLLADEAGNVMPNTTITGLLTGAGGTGTYLVNQSQTVALEAMTTSMSTLGQVQPVTWRDLQMMDGINLTGIRWKVFISGQLDGVVRPELKGGDTVVISTGRHRGTWLVAQVLEQWPDWVTAAITLQNLEPMPPPPPPPILDVYTNESGQTVYTTEGGAVLITEGSE